MKKRDGLLFILIFLFVILSANINSIDITGEATSGVNMNITVTAPSLPTLNLISPKNFTYTINQSLLLNYSAANAQAVWYKLDNGVNITITSSINFNISYGSHTLFLYANSSFGDQTSKNVTFYVGSGIFSMNFSKFQGSYKGDSTNFNYYSYEEMQNLSSIQFEDTRYGKIYFNNMINLTDDDNFYDYEIEIDRYMNITSNFIWIDSNYLSNFNTSATLTLTGLTLTTPQILIDENVCPSTICTQQSYSSGTLIFNVTHFSSFSSEETPVSTSPGSSGSSGGGGSSTPISVKSYSMSPKDIKVKLKQGQTIAKEIKITNTGTKELEIILSSEKISGFLRLSETSFTLKPQETKVINIDILARKSTIPDLYIGKIVLSGDINEEILTAIEVASEKSLFDVSVEIPQRFQIEGAGKEIIANVKLFNLGGIGRTDVLVEYEIRNSNGDSILKSSETIAVETQVSLSKIFAIPLDTSDGDYVLYVKTTTPEGDVASSTAWFSVGKVLLTKTQMYLYIFLAFIFVIILFMIYEIRKIKKQVILHSRINEMALRRRGLIKIKKEKGGKK